MRIRALQRFNQHDVGEEFDAKAEDARAWIKAGYAEAAGKANDGPPVDKAIKKAKVKK